MMKRGFIMALRTGIFLLNAVIFFSPLNVKAQEIKQLTLQQAIDLSIQNSNQLKASLARNDRAAAELRMAMDNKLPSAGISGSYLRLANPNISIKTKAFGTSTDTSGNKGAAPSVNQAIYGIANVSIPIFAGGKIRYGIESAKYLQQATLLDAENNKEEVIFNTIKAYVNLYKASVTVKVVNENLQQSEHRDSVLARLEQNGLLARNDLLKAQLQTSNISLSLLDAQSNLKMAIINMNLMIGLPESTAISPDSSDFQKTFGLKTIGEYEQLALHNRHDILALSFRKKAATAGISMAKADLYPSIALSGGYIAADVPHLITITNAITAGIGLQYNIGSLWKTKANISKAQARVKEIIANEAQLEDEIKQQVNQNFQNYLLSQKRTEVYKKAVIQAEENYRITKNKYDNALVNTTELLDANVLLLQSKINLAVAKADVYLAYSKLLETTGILSTNK